MKKNELLIDYCQRCGAEIGSFECCQSSTNKSLREDDEEELCPKHGDCLNCEYMNSLDICGYE